MQIFSQKMLILPQCSKTVAATIYPRYTMTIARKFVQKQRYQQTRNYVKRKIDESDSNDEYHFIPAGESDIPRGSWFTMLSKDQENKKMLMLTAVSEVGFRISVDNSFLYGPIAVFPKTALSWRVPTPEHITPESLELFFMLQPKLDMLIIGAGDRKDIDKVRKQVGPAIAQQRIGYEIMSTEDAIPTFNFMNLDHRYVAAALFPPRELIITELDHWERITEIQKMDFPIEEGDLSFGIFAQIDTMVKQTEESEETFDVRDAAYRIWGFRSEKAEEMLKKISEMRAEKAAHRMRRLEEKFERTQLENYLEAKKHREEREAMEMLEEEAGNKSKTVPPTMDSKETEQGEKRAIKESEDQKKNE